MKCADKLEEELELAGEDILSRGLPFIKAFKEFDKVVSSCFGLTLDPSFETHLQEFKESYTELDISVTIKVKMVKTVSLHINNFDRCTWFLSMCHSS